MFRNLSLHRILVGTACAATLAAGVCTGGAASAESDSCREWLKDHCRYKARVMGLYLRGAPQSAIDTAVFEMLQREAYLTSCDNSAQTSREALVGWRLVDVTPDDYAGAVLEAVLERSGFDLDLSSRLSPALTPPGPGVPGALAGRDLARRPKAARFAGEGGAGAPR